MSTEVEDTQTAAGTADLGTLHTMLISLQECSKQNDIWSVKTKRNKNV